MPRKGKGVRRILKEQRRFQEKRKQSDKFRRTVPKKLKEIDYKEEFNLN